MSVATPDFRFVNFEGAEIGEDLLQLKVSSEDDVCAVVSVQPFSCPVSDTEATIRDEGSFQTTLSVASFVVDPESKRRKGVFVVFVVSANDKSCRKATSPPTNFTQRLKTFTFEITDGLSKKKITLEVVLTVGFVVIVCVVTIVSVRFYSVYETKHVERKLEKIKTGFEEAKDRRRGSICGVIVDEANNNQMEMQNLRRASEMLQKMNRIHLTEDRLPKYVSELSTKAFDREQRKLYKSMFQKSDLYMWLVCMMGMFYGLPAIQLFINHQHKLVQTGDMDMCYYNFLCALPSKRVRDFNHIFSNIAYLGFGSLFIFLTWFRKIQHERFIKRLNTVAGELETEEAELEYGIPQHFGMFYAIGFSMILEGFFSSCYHVCPTTENFQFDTTFMYLLAMLCFLKMYQFRHPDVVSSAYKAFFGLGLVMFFEVLGIFYGHSTVFWVIFLTAYFVTCVILTSIFYHAGKWSLDMLIFWRLALAVYDVVKHPRRRRSYSKKRLIFVIVLNAANLAFLISGAIIRPGVSSYLLGIFITNLAIYFLYYFSMKIYHKERMTISVYVYATLMFLSWAFAIYFFVNADYSTLISAAESRNLNEECLLLDMYDHHDIWHMLSAAGLFFSFTLLMLLDDGLCYVPRNRIHIF